jgi:hypothetical protein
MGVTKLEKLLRPPNLQRNINHQGMGQSGATGGQVARDNTVMEVEDGHQWFFGCSVGAGAVAAMGLETSASGVRGTLE